MSDQDDDLDVDVVDTPEKRRELLALERQIGVLAPTSLQARRLRRELNKQAGIVGGVDEQHVVGRAGMTVFVGDVGSGNGELGSGNVQSRAVVGAVVVSGSWRLEGALLHDVPPEPDTSPDPEPLWRQVPPTIPPSDKPVHREPALEVWFGDPRMPSSKDQVIEVRDLPRYRDPSAWRRWLGPVAFSIALRASWFDPHTPRPRARAGQPTPVAPPPVVLGAWGPLDPVPASLGPSTPEVVWLSVGGGLVRLANTGQVRDGVAVYGMTGEQERALSTRVLSAGSRPR